MQMTFVVVNIDWILYPVNLNESMFQFHSSQRFVFNKINMFDTVIPYLLITSNAKTLDTEINHEGVYMWVMLSRQEKNVARVQFSKRMLSSVPIYGELWHAYKYNMQGEKSRCSLITTGYSVYKHFCPCNPLTQTNGSNGCYNWSKEIMNAISLYENAIDRLYTSLWIHTNNLSIICLL